MSIICKYCKRHDTDSYKFYTYPCSECMYRARDSFEPTEEFCGNSHLKEPDYNGFDKMSKDQLEGYAVLAKKSNVMFLRQIAECKEVIDLIAEELDLTDKGHYIYGTYDSASPIVGKIREYISRGGDKAKLKKRVDELERENETLRSLITVKGGAL